MAPEYGWGRNVLYFFCDKARGQPQPVFGKGKWSPHPYSGAYASSGNQMPISRAADSSESEPWTMLKVTSSA